MVKQYVKRGSYWSNKKRLGRISARLKAGDTLVNIGKRFGTTRQNISNVISRHGIDAKFLRKKGAKKT